MHPSDFNRCACCTKPIPHRLLMCNRHWHMVPREQAEAVKSAWQQLRRGHSPLIRRAALQTYSEARHQAVTAVQRLLEAVPAPDDLSTDSATRTTRRDPREDA